MAARICEQSGKMRHKTEVEALLAALRRQRDGAPKLRVYNCPHCGGFHLTKKV